MNLIDIPSNTNVLPQLGGQGPNVQPPKVDLVQIKKKKLSEMTREEIEIYEAKIEADKAKAKLNREQTQSKLKLKLASEVGVSDKFAKFLTKSKVPDKYHFKLTNLDVEYLQDLCNVLNEFIEE